MSGGSESRLGAAISTRVRRIVFTVETGKMVRTDQDHNSQLKQIEGEFIDFMMLAVVPVLFQLLLKVNFIEILKLLIPCDTHLFSDCNCVYVTLTFYVHL
jgi:hypothetical protein